MTMNPIRALKEGRFRDIPAIIQIVKDEGLLKSIGNFCYFTYHYNISVIKVGEQVKLINNVVGNLSAHKKRSNFV